MRSCSPLFAIRVYAAMRRYFYRGQVAKGGKKNGILRKRIMAAITGAKGAIKDRLGQVRDRFGLAGEDRIRISKLP